MPTQEKIVLDPPELLTGRSSFEITPWVDQDGADWGEASIEPVFADKDRGSVPVDFRLPNREVTVPLNIANRGTVTSDEARTALQAKVSLFQKEGGWLKRVTNQGGTVFADILDASISVGSPSGVESKQNIEIGASLTLTCLPDFYQAERTLADHTESTLPEITFSETSVFGDYPSRVRIVVDDDQGQNQRGLVWGFRNRHYSSANTASLAYQAEALNPIGGASKVATTGASGGTAVKLAPLFPAWSPMLTTTKGGTVELTHTGEYNVYARARLMGTASAQLRLSWDVGDTVNAVVNEPWTIPNPGAGSTKGTAFYFGSLGEIRLDPNPVGTHRWKGQIDAQTTAGTADLRIDRLFFQPISEGAGKLSAPQVNATQPATLIGFDALGITGGSALCNYSAALGGNWIAGTAGVSTGDNGDGDDFLGYAVAVVRNPAADVAGAGGAALTNGRYAVLSGSSTLAAIEAQVDVSLPTISTSGKEVRGGVLVRFVDTDNWVAALRRYWLSAASVAHMGVILLKRVAGTTTTLGAVDVAVATGWHTIKVTVDTAGNARVYTAPAGSSDLGAAKISVNADANLATGGALDDGKIGIYDASDLASAGARAYKQFRAYTPTSTSVINDAVIYANRSAQLTTDGHYRLDVGGTAYGPVSTQAGDLPRLPVSGLEGRTTQVFIKGSRGDLDSLPDAGIDDISARVYYRPSYLTLGTI